MGNLNKKEVFQIGLAVIAAWPKPILSTKYYWVFRVALWLIERFYTGKKIIMVRKINPADPKPEEPPKLEW